MFEKYFEEIVNFLLKDNDIEMSPVHKYLDEMIKYTVFEGKQNRAKLVVNSYIHLTNDANNSDKVKLAHIIGCCIEMIQAGFLIHDDIMDKSEMRRQKRCWNLVNEDNGYGLLSINDGLYLDIVIFKVLKKYFRSMPCYIAITDLFNKTIYRTVKGQYLDMITSCKTNKFDNFTQSRYEAIVKWKTAYYSFCMPVFGAMILAGETDKALFQLAKKILTKIGEYFQIQDDYLDCYGDPAVTGKIGTDIEENKCSWLVVQALNLATDAQISLLREHYGKDDSDSVRIVKDIYNQLELDQLYQKYEENVYVEITKMIEESQSGDGRHLPKAIFIDLINTIYKRKK